MMFFFYYFQHKLDFPFSELFLWAVFCNMHEMALMLWKRGENVLFRALVARKLYLDMKQRLEKEFSSTNEVLIERMEKNAK